MVEFLSRHEVLQVLVVRPDLYQVSGSFQEVPPLFQCADDSKHLFVVNLVIPFHWRQGFAIEGHRVPFLLSRWLLREDSSRGEVGAVSLDAEGFRILRQYQDWSSGHRCFETFKGFLFLGVPVPGLVGASEVKEGPGDG